jgi:hypothetical protein
MDSRVLGTLSRRENFAEKTLGRPQGGTSGYGTFETCRLTLRMSVYRVPEVIGRGPKRRF